MGSGSPQDAQKATKAVPWAATLVPGPGADDLLETFERCSPWVDEARSRAELYGLATRRGWTVKGRPFSVGDAGIVAEAMARVARGTSGLSDDQFGGIAFGMVRNVGRGRDATESNPLADHFFGFIPETLRRYRRDHGLDALARFSESLQRQLDVDALVRGGRSPAAARQWLRQHPGLHASDAPPPRRTGIRTANAPVRKGPR